MTQPAATTSSVPTHRSAGRASIASGVIGIVAIGYLIVALVYMYTAKDESIAHIDLAIKVHGFGVMLQSVSMIPVAFALHTLAHRASPSSSRAILFLGVGALSLIALMISLYFLDVASDTMYMVPQGVMGIWLVIVNRRLSSVLPRWITRFGVIVGIGLVLVGTFPWAFGLLVDPIGLYGPVPFDHPDRDSYANAVIHIVLLIGTLMGVLTLPIWSILLGRRLLRLPVA